MRTFLPDVYFEKLRNQKGLETKIPPYLLASYAADIHATVSSLNATVQEQNVASCARLFRNKGTYLENSYKT